MSAQLDLPNLECVKNTRDLASVAGSPGITLPCHASVYVNACRWLCTRAHAHGQRLNESVKAVKPGRVFRTSCVGTASENDSCIIVDNIKTLIDLRSDKEYLKDSEKYNSTVWENYDDMIYSVTKSKRGRIKVLTPTKAEVLAYPFPLV